jgi:hypothetical protein
LNGKKICKSPAKIITHKEPNRKGSIPLKSHLDCKVKKVRLIKTMKVKMTAWRTIRESMTEQTVPTMYASERVKAVRR